MNKQELENVFLATKAEVVAISIFVVSEMYFVFWYSDMRCIFPKIN